MENVKAMIMDEAAISRALRRIAHEIIERNSGCADVALIGIRRRGVPLAKRIAAHMEQIEASVSRWGKLTLRCTAMI